MRVRWPLIVVVIVLLSVLALYFGATDWDKSVPEDVYDSEGNEIEKENESLEAMNILVLGLDARDGGIGRTDSIMLIGYHPDKDDITLLSIPRDTRVKIKGSYDKVNAAYVYGGPELALKTIEDFLEIEIDHYAVVDFQGFERIVDLVGGIEVDVPVRMHYAPEGIDLQPGKQLLNGKDALAYSRYRGTTDGDLDRAERQQQVLTLLTKKLISIKSVVKLPSILDILQENIITDIGAANIAKLAPKLPDIQDKNLNHMILPGANRKLDLWYYIPDEDKLPEISNLFK